MFRHLYKSIILFVLILSASQTIYAQSQGFLDAEKVYKSGDYYTAIGYYNDYLTGKASKLTINTFTGYLSKPNITKKEVVNNPRTQAAFHLAECYRMVNDWTNAEGWYDSAANMKGAEQFPSIGYWYGVCLRANGKIPAAKTAFQQYVSTHDEKETYYAAAKKELADIDFAAKELAKKQRRKIIFQRVKEPVNGRESNYAPFVSGQNFIFSSTREDTSIASSKINPYQHHIYSSIINVNGFTDPVKVTFKQDKNIQQGAATFSADGKTVFLTQWTTEKNKKTTGAIYMSTKTDSNWTAPTKLDSTINVNGYTSQQPFISNDGKYLFFSSDRPGGLGKFDIWVAELNKNYETQSVINLDNTVNTREDEKAPYYNTKNQTLVFSSNGRVGMGGYDLYYSKKAGAMFNEAVNFGTPVNGIKDDIYFYSKENTEDLLDQAWISSDRVSSCCLELFSIHRLPPPVNHITGTVKNQKTNAPMADVAFDWNHDGKSVTIHTNSRGEYDIVVPDDANYTVSLYNPGYYDTTVALKHSFDTMNDSLYSTDFYLKPVPEVVKDYMVYFSFAKYDLNDTSKKILDSVVTMLSTHPTWKMSVEGYTDGKGSDEYNLKLSQNRTDTCLSYLAEHQIDKTRLVPASFGKAKPAAPNTTPEGKDNPDGRQLNRRVKLSVIKD